MDPRSGDVIARVAAGAKDDVDLAVKAARDAFDHGKWPRMSGFVSSLSFLCFIVCILIIIRPQLPRLPLLSYPSKIDQEMNIQR